MTRRPEGKGPRSRLVLWFVLAFGAIAGCGEARVEPSSPGTFALDATWLRLGGPAPTERAELARWLEEHPRLRGVAAHERAAFVSAMTQRLGASPRGVRADALAGANWTLDTLTPVTSTAAAVVAGPTPSPADRVVLEGADSPAHYIAVVSNLHGATPTVTKSPSIGAALDRTAIVTNLAGTVAYAVTSAGRLHAVNVADATIAWTVQVGPVSGATPWLEFGSGLLYLGDLGGYVTAVNTSTGAVQWTTPLAAPIHSSPIVLGGQLWVGADDGHLYRLNPSTGAAIGQPTRLCLGATCTANDAIWSALTGVGDVLTLGVNRRIIELNVSDSSGCGPSTATACGYTAYPIQDGSFIAPPGRFEGGIAIDVAGSRMYFGYANRLWRASFNFGLTSAFSRLPSDDPTGLLRGWNPTSHGYPRSVPLVSGGAILLGDGGGVLHRFLSTGTEEAWTRLGSSAVPGLSGPAIESSPVLDFAAGSLYLGVKEPSGGRWVSMPRNFSSDVEPTGGAAVRFRLTATGLAAAGVPFSVTVTALDAQGQRARGYAGTVQFTSNEAGASLPAPVTFGPADAGQRTLSVTFNSSGARLLTVHDAAGGLSGATAICVGSSDCAATVTRDKASYASGEKVVISFGHLLVATGRRLALQRADGTEVASADTLGWLEGSRAWSFLPGGTYTARVYGSGPAPLAVSSSFTVAASTSSVSTSLASYAFGAPVVVSWANAPTAADSFVAIALDGAPSSDTVATQSTAGAAAGSASFTTLLGPGTYRARLMIADGNTLVAESAAFTVQPGCGDGAIGAGELCDDGNRTSNDGCSASCEVEPGWMCAGEPTSCSDIDECADGNGGCSTNPPVTCTNTPGGRTCGPCPSGFVGDGMTCFDINECAINNGGCSTDPMVNCINTLGSRSCGPCPAGYTGNGVTCIDIDECATNNGGCSTTPAVTCTNTPGGRACGACPAGYTGNGVTCIDIDECATNNGGCSTTPAVTCTNTPGGRACGACPNGYTGDGITCTDIDECATNNGGCSTTPLVTCTNTPGGRACGACPAGYTGNGVTCIDIDECATNNGGCSTTPLVACTNTPGGRVCGACPAGYTGNGITCIDIDECATDNGGCSTTPAVTCTNTPGGRACGACPSGYTGNGITCIDIDECATNNGGCSTTPLVACTNTPGGSTCGACPAGYTGNGVTCIDIDECATNNGGCSTTPLVACTNMPGGRTCGSCPDGYTGDGTTCTASPGNNPDPSVGCGCGAAAPGTPSVLAFFLSLVVLRRRRSASP